MVFAGCRSLTVPTIWHRRVTSLFRTRGHPILPGHTEHLPAPRRRGRCCKPHSGLSSLGERATVETGVIAVGRRARTTRLTETDAGRRTGVPDAGPLPSESVAGYGPEAP